VFCLSFQDWKIIKEKIPNCSVILALLLPLKEPSAALKLHLRIVLEHKSHKELYKQIRN